MPTSQAGLVRIDFLFVACGLCVVARFDTDFVLLKLNRFNDEVDADDLRLKLDILSIFLKIYSIVISIQIVILEIKLKCFSINIFEKKCIFF